MLVWNGFVFDARVTREAETLVGAGVSVRVICVLTDQRPIAEETTAGGVQVVRVSRRVRWLSRLLLAPRVLLYFLLERLQGRESRSLLREAFESRAAWWELDRKLAMACELLAGNIRMMIAAVEFEPDFVHANDVNTLVPGWIAAIWASAHLVYDAHEISADREGYRGRIWLVKLVEKHLGGSASGRMTTTRTRADWFMKNYGYPNMGVVQNRPQYSEVKADRIRTTYQIPADKLVVLYQGGLQPGRGLHNLIKAVRAVPHAHLVFVGDGRQRASLEAAAADLKDRVHFVGQVPLSELPEWTASADVGMQTLRNTCLNHYSTDSNKLFEYVMGGLAVIASDFPEIRLIVTEFDLGILVDPDDVGELSEAIAKFAADRESLRRFRMHAQESRGQLDWQSQVPSFLSVYRLALNRDG
jgi:glycosyltransferase involved in cell wall biosynthesis